VWLVRQGPLYFTLPIVTGTKRSRRLSAGAARFAGLRNPVEQVYPSLTPFIELRRRCACDDNDGADEISPPPLVVHCAWWAALALIGGKAGLLVDPHITRQVTWRIEGSTLVPRMKL